MPNPTLDQIQDDFADNAFGTGWGRVAKSAGTADPAELNQRLEFYVAITGQTHEAQKYRLETFDTRGVAVRLGFASFPATRAGLQGDATAQQWLRDPATEATVIGEIGRASSTNYARVFFFGAGFAFVSQVNVSAQLTDDGVFEWFELGSSADGSAVVMRLHRGGQTYTATVPVPAEFTASVWHPDALEWAAGAKGVNLADGTVIAYQPLNAGTDNGALVGAVPPPPTPTVTGVTATPNPTSVPEDGNGQVTVTVAGTNNPPQTVDAESSDPSVVTSTDAGVLTGHKAGTATIRYTSTLHPGSTNPAHYVDVPVTVVAVAPPPKPAIGVSPAQLAFAATAGGASPASKSFSIMNTGPGGTTLSPTPDVTVLPGAPWLAATFGGGVVTVTATTGALAASTSPYSGTVRVTDPAASNSPVDVPVLFLVTAPTQAPPTPTPDFPNAGTLVGYARRPGQVVKVRSVVPGVVSVPATVTASSVETAPGSGLYAYQIPVAAVGSAAANAVLAEADFHDPTAYSVEVKAAPTA
jgi:hypothetical protein